LNEIVMQSFFGGHSCKVVSNSYRVDNFLLDYLLACHLSSSLRICHFFMSR